MKVMKVKKALGIAMTTAMVFTMAMPAFASGVPNPNPGTAVSQGTTGSQTASTQNVGYDANGEAAALNAKTNTKQVDASIKINHVPEGAKEHVFEAYQIFRGDISDTLNGVALTGNDRILSNVQWGANFDTSKEKDFYAELKSMGIQGKDAKGNPVDIDSARSFAEALSWMENDSEKLIDISRMLDKYLTGTPLGTLKKGDKDGTNSAGIDTYSYSISGLPAGYYFVKDKNESQDDVQNGNYTRIILKLVGDSVVNAKSDTVKSEKKVREDTKFQEEPNAYGKGYNDTNDAEIGEVVDYEFLAPIIEPSEIAKFVNDYHYIFHDKMSEGLTFLYGDNKSYLGKDYDVTVEIYGGNADNVGYNAADKKATLVKGTDFTVNDNPGDGHTFDVDITLYNKTTGKFAANAENLKKNDVVVVKFSARVNDKAVIGGAGNENDMKLQYSNNPNGDGTGETPEDKVVTFVYELDVDKIDGQETDDAKKALDDAYFVFYKEPVIENGEIVSAKYAKIDESTNKLIGWTEQIKLAMPSQSDLDKWNNTWGDADKKAFEDSFEVAQGVSVLVSKGGKFTISGLDDDTYFLKEVKAPKGYNLLDKDIKVVITADTNNGQDSTLKLGKLERTFDLVDAQNPEKISGNLETGEVAGIIANNRGTVLPSTGGMGTTLFYAIGGVLLVGAAVLLVTRKRVEA